MNQLLDNESEFKIVLQNELIDRCRKNPRYSLRRFAQSLEIDHSLLAKYLNGKRRIPKITIFKVGKKLCLSPAEIDSLSGFPVDNKNTSSVISEDIFRMIADWYHFAILELMKLPTFQPESAWIGGKLGISNFEANCAIDRLLRVGLIQKRGNTLVHTKKNNMWDHIETSTARKKLQRQILEKSLTALELLPIEKREHSSLTVAMNSKDLKKLKARVQSFKEDVDQFLIKKCEGKLDSVYQIQISVFPLTNIESIKN